MFSSQVINFAPCSAYKTYLSPQAFVESGFGWP